MRRLALLALLALPLTARADNDMMWPTLQGAGRKVTAPGSLFADDGNTVAHVYFNGTSLKDKQANSWTLNGSISQVAASGKIPPGAGPFSDANYYSLGTGNDVLDFAGTFTVCVAWRQTGTTVARVANDSSGANTSGWSLYANAGVNTQMGGAGLSQPNSTIIGVNVACFGRSGTTGYLKANKTSTVTGTVGTTADTATPAKLGSESNTQPLANGVLYEVWASTSTPSDAALTAQVNHAFTTMGL